MKRIAFTIILNGYNHLLHKDYYRTMIEMFDHWILVEGVAKNNGSTSWCNNLNENYHNNFLSNDGTKEFIDKLASEHENVHIVRSNNGFWSSKDEQVNAAIAKIKEITDHCMLWQVDIDEQWTLEQIITAETELQKNGGKTGCFLCNYYVGKEQIVYGEWGEGKIEPYRRLWNWSGEDFASHEPPKLNGDNNPRFLLTPRFNHYSYYFDEDVKFKEAYYGNYEGLYNRWQNIQQNRGRLPIRALLGDKLWWSNTNTIIQYSEYAR
jgi:hypothetical protein